MGELLLLLFLDMAVPLQMQRMEHLSADEVARIGREAGPVVAEKGDIIQFRANGTAGATAALVRGLAAAALAADGGVTFADRHWCTDHGRCMRTAS